MIEIGDGTRRISGASGKIWINLDGGIDFAIRLRGMVGGVWQQGWTMGSANDQGAKENRR